MTEQTRAEVSKLVPWIVAVLVAIGSAAMTLQYSQDRIEKLEAWQMAHAEGQHSQTSRDVALIRANLTTVDRDRQQQATDRAEIGRQLLKLTRTTDALCVASPRCKPGD